MDKEVFITGSGDPAPAVEIRKVLDRRPFIIAADGGIAHLEPFGAVPHLVIGDMDSIDQSALKRAESSGSTVHRFPRKKDKSDMELAADEAVSMNPSAITVTGALGGRTDHGLFNLQLLFRLTEKGIKARILGPVEEIFPVGKEEQFSFIRGTVVSLIPMEGPVEKVTITGFRYPLTNETLYPGFSRSLSNVAEKSPQTVTFQRGKLLICAGYLPEGGQVENLTGGII